MLGTTRRKSNLFSSFQRFYRDSRLLERQLTVFLVFRQAQQYPLLGFSARSIGKGGQRGRMRFRYRKTHSSSNSTSKENQQLRIYHQDRRSRGPEGL